MQSVLMYIAVIGALGFLIKKWFWKGNPRKPKGQKPGCGGTDCGCS